jgi:hypothetical protein
MARGIPMVMVSSIVGIPAHEYAGASPLAVRSSIPMISIVASSDEILRRATTLIQGVDGSISSMHPAILSIHGTSGRPRDSIS